VKTNQRGARIIHIWLTQPASTQTADEVLSHLGRWHASTYPSSPSSPLEAAFFDHSKAEEAVCKARTLPSVARVSLVHHFEIGRRYQSHGAECGGDLTLQCVARRSGWVEFVHVDEFGNTMPGSRVRKKRRFHEKTTYLYGDYAELDRKRRVYAADDVGDDQADS